MAAQPQPRLTPEEYLKLERASEFRHEYYDGHVYAMSGGSIRHGLIIANVSGELRNALKKGRCFVTSNDVRVRVATDGLYTYPDVIVVCGEPETADDQRDTLLNPTLLIEVLSRSTEAYDRGFKAAQYRTIASLQEYALVSQEEPRVEIFRRQPGGHWLFSESIGCDATCRFESVGCEIALGDIFDKVKFEPSASPLPTSETGS